MQTRGNGAPGGRRDDAMPGGRGRTTRRGLMGGAAVLLAALASACGTGAGGGGGEAERQDASVTDTTPVTLNVLSAEGGSTARLEAYEEINRAFMREHPNVTIKQTEKSFTDLMATIKLQLSDASPIDAVQTNQGYYTMGALVKAKLLRPLDPYAEQYGWGERQPASLLAMTRMNDAGTQLGEGRLFGVAATGDAVGIYFNRSKLRELGLEPPTTFAEFERQLEVAREAGETPIKFGNLDKWPGVNEWQTLLNAGLPADELRSLVFGTGGSFDAPQVRRSVARMQDWVKKGYFEEDVNAISYEDATTGFAEGDGVFLIGGTWLNADLKGDMGDEAGFVLAPGVTERETATAASGGFPWGIPTKSKFPDVAAQYIDFVTGPEAARIFLAHGDIPALAAPEGGGEQDALTTAAVDAWKRLKEQDAFHPYIDWATPTMNETMTAAIQEALALKISPDEFARRLQGDYAEFAAKR